jgi:hypothetical protein
MSKLITNNIKLFNVDQFIESFSESNFNIYYFYVGNPIPFDNDNSPPTLYDNVSTTFIDPHETMLYGKRITSSDIVQMIPRHNWTSNTVYSKYTHTDIDLFDSSFYVLSDEGSSYSVFKCLDNNSGAPSTYRPRLSETSADDDFYFTTIDGYQWKYMYSITTSQFNKFSTSSHIPVFVNANVVGNSVSGSIDNIQISASGSGYSSYTNGVFQEVRVSGNPLIYSLDPATSSSNTNFYVDSAIKITSGVGSGQQRKITGYTVSGSTRRVIIDTAFNVNPTTASVYEITPIVTIQGDGTGAQARAIVNSVSNSIFQIEIVERGQGYTYANVSITGNTGIINVSSNTLISPNSAIASVIISPKNGHGSNAAAELGGHYAGISVTFDSSISGGSIVNENDFRVAGIIKDPLFANVTLSISNSTGSFTDGEIVYQNPSNTANAFGVVSFSNSSSVRLTNAFGFFVSGNSTYGLLNGVSSGFTAIVDSSTQPTTHFDQTFRVVGSLQSATGFVEDEFVIQGNPGEENGSGFFYSSNSTVVRLSNKKGSFNQSEAGGSQAFISGVDSGADFLVSGLVPPDLVKNSGDVIYIENFSPITKANSQTETLKLVLEF